MDKGIYMVFSSKCFKCGADAQTVLNTKNGDEEMCCSCGAVEIREFGIGKTQYDLAPKESELEAA